MAFNNIYDWHDSMRKGLEKEIEKDRSETMADRMNRYWVEGKSRVNRETYRFKLNREDWLKDIEVAKEDCGRKFPRKYGNNTDPNDITDLCKVEIIN